MTDPKMTDMTAVMSTAAAERSFTLPITGCRSGDTRLHNCSRAVLNNSATRTAAIQPATAIHSSRLMPNTHPAPAASMAASRWILKLVSERKHIRRPFAAYKKDRKVFPILIAGDRLERY